MGLERLASVLQGYRSNYDIDIFQKIFVAIQNLCPGVKPYGGELKDPVDIAYRVVADHIRTLTVALADGAVPSNQDRGYVLRRILRRAIRYGNDFLNAPTGFFAKLADAVDETLGGSFPDIRKNLADVKSVLLDEELQFRRTLEKGTKEFKARASRVDRTVSVLSGSDAFVLFTTYGFPLDLTQLMAAELGLAVDVEGFNVEFEKFRQQSRDASMFGASGNDMVITLGPHETHYLEKVLKLAQTDDLLKFNWSSGEGVGPDAQATLKAVFDGKQWLQSVDGQTVVALVFDKTPFYAEAGGQIYDVGTISSATTGFTFEVKNTQKYGGYVIHIGQVLEGEVKLGEQLTLTVDFARRSLVAKNHTGTHILNLALREVLGDKVDQKGSLVEPSRLRFDFSWSRPMEFEEVKKVDQLVNQQIVQKLAVFAEEVELSKAQTIPGIRAVFGETYPNPVRVLSVGRNVQTLLNGEAVAVTPESIEFCGGTHVANTAEITRFVVLAEEGVAKGVRRVVAVTGPEAIKAERRAADLQLRVDEVVAGNFAAADSLKIAISEDKDLPYVARRSMLAQLEVVIAEQFKKDKEKFKELQKAAVKSAEGVIEALDATSDFFVVDFPELLGDNKSVGVAVDTLVTKASSKAFLVMSSGNGKTVYIATVPKTLTSKRSAKAWVEHVSKAVNGKGGGSDARAQGTVEGVAAESVMTAAKSFLH
jgi:alanyl-tRNA synthetase